ncbi:LacI family DNA-binding transcriptional regulator [Oryzobacter telluris]|uniref:LacI family DNA-binding transcriptional regulator n=1 Tax=Oryzobacter telluris TaxID=3149179 RepID=UPI00370D95F0
MSTMRDVAERAGVSAKSVSRVLRDDKYVSESVRSRVLAAVEELHYVPNTLAVSFRAGRDTAIGVAVPDLADPFFAEAVQAIEAVARQRGAAVLVSSIGYDKEREHEAIEPLLHRQVSGLIVCPVASDQSYLRRWEKRIPLMFIDRAPRHLNADVVVQDDASGARDAVEHLVKEGHRRVAFIGDDPVIATGVDRLRAYRETLQSHSLPFDESLVIYDEADGAHIQDKLHDVRDTADPPTAIFCSNARTALVTIPALRQLDWGGVALVSFGDFPLSSQLDPPVCVIDQDPRGLGQFAATRVFDRLDHPHRRFRRRTVMPVRLLDRGGCGLQRS